MRKAGGICGSNCLGFGKEPDAVISADSDPEISRVHKYGFAHVGPFCQLHNLGRTLRRPEHGRLTRQRKLESAAFWLLGLCCDRHRFLPRFGKLGQSRYAAWPMMRRVNPEREPLRGDF